MRYSILFMFLVSLIWIACEDQNEIDLLNVQDEFAVLNDEMALAASYNDSLASYINLTGANNDVRCWHFDEHFHLHDSLYNMHHNNYNSSYGWNNHSMGNGGMMHGQNSQGGPRFCQENDDFMDSLRHAHSDLHPDF